MGFGGKARRTCRRSNLGSIHDRGDTPAAPGHRRDPDEARLLDGAAATPLWSLTGPEAAHTAGDLERLSAKVAALPARHLRTAPLVLGGDSPPLASAANAA